MYTPTRTCVYVLVSLYDISISIGLSIYCTHPNLFKMICGSDMNMILNYFCKLL